MTAPVLPDLFKPGNRLTRGITAFSSGMAGLEGSLRHAFPHLRDIVPLGREPVRHRTAGWTIGSVGVAIGEHPPLRLETAGRNGLLLYAPVRGSLSVWQDGARFAAPAADGWILFDERPARAESGANQGIIITLQRERLQSTFDIMVGAPAGPVCPKAQRIDLQTPIGRLSVDDLPLLLGYGSKASLRWPSGIPQAEDVVYRFVSRLLMPDVDVDAMRLRGVRSRHVVDLACGYMMSRIDEAIALTEVEQVAGVGARSLQQAFGECLGTTPKAWLKEQRLLLAHHLITQGDKSSVSAAATASGLNHFGRFSADFRLRFGVSPSALAGHPQTLH